MMIFEKKGMSEVVATMLLVLLAVLGVTIIAGFIIPFIKTHLPDNGCFKVKDYLKFDDSFGFNCYEIEASSYKYLLTIRAGGDNSTSDRINGLKLRFFEENKESEILEIKKGATPGALGMMGGGNLDVPLSGGKYSVLSYNYTSNRKYDKVEVYLLIDDKLCDISDSMKLSKCS